jgi:hypothetical protein
MSVRAENNGKLYIETLDLEIDFARYIYGYNA